MYPFHSISIPSEAKQRIPRMSLQNICKMLPRRKSVNNTTPLGIIWWGARSAEKNKQKYAENRKPSPTPGFGLLVGEKMIHHTLARRGNNLNMRQTQLLWVTQKKNKKPLSTYTRWWNIAAGPLTIRYVRYKYGIDISRKV